MKTAGRTFMDRPDDISAEDAQHLERAVMVLLNLIQTAPEAFQGTLMCSLIANFCCDFGNPAPVWKDMRDALDRDIEKFALMRRVPAGSA